MTPTPRTDRVSVDVQSQLERELNEKLKAATVLLTRCRDAAGRMEIGLYEDIQEFLHTQP